MRNKGEQADLARLRLDKAAFMIGRRGGKRVSLTRGA